MRSWPVTEAIMVLVLGLLVLFPMLNVTGHSPVMDADHHESESVAVPPLGDVICWLTVRSPHKMEGLRLVCEGEELLNQQGTPFKRIEESFSLPISSTGVELMVEAKWPAGTPETMVEVLLEPDRQELRRNSLWGEGEVGDILSFRWP